MRPDREAAPRVGDHGVTPNFNDNENYVKLRIDYFQYSIDTNLASCYCVPVKVNKSLIKRYFKAHLAVSAQWAVKGMLVIYSRQTLGEQASQMTSELNSVGFSGVDAEILSSFSDQVKRGRTLSPKQMAIVFKKMPKYWEQLWDNSKNQEATFAAALAWEAKRNEVQPVKS